MLLPVTVLQYISSINSKLKLRKVLHAQHRASLTYMYSSLVFYSSQHQ